MHVGQPEGGMARHDTEKSVPRRPRRDTWNSRVSMAGLIRPNFHTYPFFSFFFLLKWPFESTHSLEVKYSNQSPDWDYCQTIKLLIVHYVGSIHGYIPVPP